MKYEKGTAGLTILLSTVTSLFVIGLLIMIYSLMGGELQKSTSDATAVQVINDTTTALSGVPTWFTIIITITVMVTLILLLTLVISAVRGTGLMQQ